MTVLLNTGKDGPGRLSASRDGTIKVVENTNIERNANFILDFVVLLIIFLLLASKLLISRFIFKNVSNM